MTSIDIDRLIDIVIQDVGPMRADAPQRSSEATAV